MTDSSARSERAALLVVDVQNDFCTGGALAVPGSEPVVARINQHVADAVARGLPVYASRDWHPAVTSHFTTHGGPWPVHCVQDTTGARFHPDLALPDDAIIITKGDAPDAHGYSAFEGHTADGVLLREDLHARGITHLYVAGLATDYCVKHSVLDARADGFRVTLLDDAVAGVDVEAGDSTRAIDAMREAGAVLAGAPR